MTIDDRYLANEGKFKADAFAVLRTHFQNRKCFEKFYASIDVSRRDSFLRACATYRYLAKHGAWKIRVRGVNPVIDYLNNSFKLLAVISIIESLSTDRHIDFYQWLSANDRSNCFPIRNRLDLETLYKQYKSLHGAARACERFFKNLPEHEIRLLCDQVKFAGKPINGLRKIVQFLYDLRSNFVHQAKFVLLLDGNVLTTRRRVHSILTIEKVCRAFELGLIAHFKA